MTQLLFWSESFWPYVGGPEITGPRLAVALRERGYRIAVVTSHGSLDLPDLDDYAGIPVHRFPFFSAFAERDIDRLAGIHRRLSRLKGDFAPDLVHINFLGPSAIFQVQTTAAHAAPLVVTLRGMLPDDLLQGGSGYAFALRAADWVTANASASLERARRHLPELAARSSVIYDGLDPPPIPPAPLPIEPPRVLCLGRLSFEKGFDLALSAFALLAGALPAARLVVAGDGPERAALQRQAADLGIAAAVDFVGWVAPESVFELINTATVVVLPSRTESLPITAVEAGQMARPVVAARVGGVPEVVVDGQTGLLVDPESPAALAGALQWLLGNPAEAARLGAEARVRTSATFSMERSVDTYDELFRRLIETAMASRRSGARLAGGPVDARALARPGPDDSSA